MTKLAKISTNPGKPRRNVARVLRIPSVSWILEPTAPNCSRDLNCPPETNSISNASKGLLYSFVLNLLNWTKPIVAPQSTRASQYHQWLQQFAKIHGWPAFSLGCRWSFSYSKAWTTISNLSISWLPAMFPRLHGTSCSKISPSNELSLVQKISTKKMIITRVFPHTKESLPCSRWPPRFEALHILSKAHKVPCPKDLQSLCGWPAWLAPPETRNEHISCR